MKVASAAYPLDAFSDWDTYRAKLAAWVETAAQAGASLLVFPEYAAMELAPLAGLDVAADLEASLHAVTARLEQADAIHAALAQRFNVHILAATGPSAHPELTRPVKRARLFGPSGACAYQDKQVMTRFEAETWDVVPGNPLQVFDTQLGMIGVLICYDAEFPLLGRALAEADVILVPSVTETAAGHARVRIGAKARALENQCVTVVSCVVGRAEWSEAVDISVGAAGVYGPPDIGFPQDGVLAQGDMNVPGWTYADIDLDAIHNVRRLGTVLNRRDWAASIPRATPASTKKLT